VVTDAGFEDRRADAISQFGSSRTLASHYQGVPREPFEERREALLRELPEEHLRRRGEDL
jgi:hypothetical protein